LIVCRAWIRSLTWASRVESGARCRPRSMVARIDVVS
jgi:hypothetical protein